MDGLNLTATAHVKLTKINNETGKEEVVEHDVELTREEAEELWRSQQQA